MDPHRTHLCLRSALGAAVVGALAVGCSTSEDSGDCGGQACNIPLTHASLLEELGSQTDPVANWLRDNADSDAVIGDDFEAIIASIGTSLGCDEARRSSFVVLSNIELAPKGVVTQCSDSPTDASRVLTIFEPTVDLDDLDGERFRMVSWDEEAGLYRRYQVTPHPQGGLGVAVGPEFCKGCHLKMAGPAEWSPIMNEMTNPWAQWNAEPGFESVLFDNEMVMQSAGEVFERLTADDRLDSASNLEPVIRSAIDRVTAAGVKRREEAPDLELAADLLRPVFCDGAVNYVSEVHTSGELKASAVLDPAIRRLFGTVAPDGPWRWVRDDVIKLPAPTADESPVTLIAVRAELSIQAEAALVSRLVLDPIDVLRVRAIDWTHPMGSTLRCDLFEDGLERAQAGTVDPSQMADTGSLVRALFEETMTTASGTTLLSADPEAIISIPDGTDPDAVAAVDSGNLGPWTTSILGWGDAIEAHYDTAQTAQGRAALRAEAGRRGCLARSRYPIAPIIPGTEGCP